MRTEWNLKKFFYASLDDPKIKRDFEAIKKAYVTFERKWRNRGDYLKDPDKLLTVLKEYEKLIAIVGPAKPLHYVHYTKELDGRNTKADAMLTKFSTELANYENRVLFFSLKIGKIEKSLQKKFLSDKRLAKYRYMLERAFENAKHELTESEEKILNLKSLPARSMWIDGVDRVVNQLTVRYKGKTIPINQAVAEASSLPTKERRELHRGIVEKLSTVGDFAESEMNAIVTDKKINDELRKFPKPYNATILGYQNTEKTILSLVDAATKAFRISHRFYSLKKKLLKEKQLTYADRSAPIGKTDKRITFPQAAKLVRRVFAGVDMEYGKVFDQFLADGHIDVYPTVGKSGGAYCSSTILSPTLVLLNHADNMKSLMTLAHEMGHAVHAEMSKRQPLIYQGHTISVAETASTLFEQLVFEELFKTLSPKEQIVALHDRINDDVSTIFRQIAFFNFELELHNTIRERGKLSKNEIAKLLNKHMAAYLGPEFKLEDVDGYYFVLVSHFRRFFYVYAYCYGGIISRAMSERFKKDPKGFAPKIKQFLTAGESMSPEAIFKSIGIDTSKKSFFDEGLRSLARDVERLEKLTKNGTLRS